jgi:hypothetical protein
MRCEEGRDQEEEVLYIDLKYHRRKRGSAKYRSSYNSQLSN